MNGPGICCSFATRGAGPSGRSCRSCGGEPGHDEECGVIYDAFHAKGLPGYSATVFLVNVFLLPPTVAEFLTLPRESYDTPEEVYDAGWAID